MDECNHKWLENSGTGGDAEFLWTPCICSNEPIMYVRCELCGESDWKTPSQWTQSDKKPRLLRGHGYE